MNSLKTCFLLTILFFIMMNEVCAQSLKAITYNIRYATEKDGDNQWNLRKEHVAGLIRFHEPDVFGIQEGLEIQVKFLDSMLTNYHYVGTGRDDGKTGGEFSALYFNQNTMELIQSGQFWLSETPDLPSKGWDAALNRICTYAFLKVRQTGNTILVLNTHFDHIGETARVNSAKLILNKIDQLNKDKFPVILMGDFNLEPDSEGIQIISKKLNDSYSHTINPPFGPRGTFNGFQFCEPIGNRIDYIFSYHFIINKYAVLSDSYDQKYLSDHFPVLVILTMEN